jgi:hypothetical protein
MGFIPDDEVIQTFAPISPHRQKSRPFDTISRQRHSQLVFPRKVDAIYATCCQARQVKTTRVKLMSRFVQVFDESAQVPGAPDLS